MARPSFVMSKVAIGAILQSKVLKGWVTHLIIKLYAIELWEKIQGLS